VHADSIAQTSNHMWCCGMTPGHSVQVLKPTSPGLHDNHWKSIVQASAALLEHLSVRHTDQLNAATSHNSRTEHSAATAAAAAPQ
jgi:hypothetical protein